MVFGQILSKLYLLNIFLSKFALGRLIFLFSSYFIQFLKADPNSHRLLNLKSLRFFFLINFSFAMSVFLFIRFMAIKTDYLRRLGQLLIFICFLFLIFLSYLLLVYFPMVFSLLVAFGCFFLNLLMLAFLILIIQILLFLFLASFILVLLFFVLFFHFLLKVLNVFLLKTLIHLTIILIYPFQNLHHLFINFSKFY